MGELVPADQIYSTATPPSVSINLVAATVIGAALAPGFAGLHQVAIRVPDLPDGDYQINAGIGGVLTGLSVRLTIKR